MAGWPFFAPSPAEAVTIALDLAEVGAGDHLVDLGCGDGKVLVEAARRGARVTGVETDRLLAAEARRALAQAGADPKRARVTVANLFDEAVWATLTDATVLFSYLSPALLQRMTPGLRDTSTRLLTVDFAVPDLLPDEVSGPARLYRLPGRLRPARPKRPGWSAPATLCVMPPDVQSLTCLDALHIGGRVRLSLPTSGLARHAACLSGIDSTPRGRPVAIDVRWRERPAGTLAHGLVRILGLPPHPLVVLFADDDQGEWELTEDGYRSLLPHLRARSRPRPTTTKELLAAAE